MKDLQSATWFQDTVSFPVLASDKVTGFQQLSSKKCFRLLFCIGVDAAFKPMLMCGEYEPVFHENKLRMVFIDL